jgi:mannose-6-phosphate isomerase-like protein (cupin superfamily)
MDGGLFAGFGRRGHGMSKSRSVVVHHPEQEAPPPMMSGTERRQQFERMGAWADWIRNDVGDVSGWHHHAANDTYVYVSRGSVTIDFGPGGARSIVARAGDFFIVPSQTIHRETTGNDVDLEAFLIRVGGEPEQVDVDGPEAVGD